MRHLWISSLLLAALLLAGCGSGKKPASKDGLAAPERQPEPLAVPGGISVVEQALVLRARDNDREVLPDTDQVFEFLVANATESDIPVTMVLEHQNGQRWRTSLCVELQCILGDGSEESRTETVMLSPFVEQPFQVHVFVDAEAEVGQAAEMELRVEPQVVGVEPKVLTLSAMVAGR